MCTGTFSTTPFTCFSVNSTVCVGMTYKSQRASSPLIDFGIQLKLSLLSAGTCSKDYQRAIDCMDYYPPCDANNFLTPVCQSLCDRYAVCASGPTNTATNTASGCQATFSSYPITVSAAATCQGYFYSGAFSLVPSLLAVVGVAVAALVGQRL
jgi:hypothetical protein